jgi:hypothetical protein
MFETSSDLTNYLAPNERVLWEGRGKRRLTSTSTGGLLFLMIFIGLALFFVVLFFTTSTSSRSRGDTAPMIIVPLMFVFIGLVVGIPLYMAGRQSSNARYLVTTLSAIIISQTAWSGKRVTVVALKNAPQITFTENRDGTGTLTFGSNPYMPYGRTYSSWYADATPAFWNIERPLEVYQLIRKTMNNDQLPS